MTEPLHVDPAALVSAGAAFLTAGTELAALRAETAVEGAAAVGPLATAGACRAVRDLVREATATRAAGTTGYGDALLKAADDYLAQDDAGGRAIGGAAPR
ncbi:type VII secretion target [uncultured Mycolicibacterium sp.]|uniref:type VII secretion target n=1 Tax=uncultured Mycolicibacterium sp. TaxID=2320817 RepID=UPI00261F0ECC|nr:type VII secretion target [uncultured Mycolicibacterium sp.]